LIDECPLERAITIATELKNSISKFRFCWGDEEFNIGASIGVTPITNSTTDIASLLSAADDACYAAKKEGRDQVRVSTTK
jgi:ammonium transporter, Amt family